MSIMVSTPLKIVCLCASLTQHRALQPRSKYLDPRDARRAGAWELRGGRLGARGGAARQTGAVDCRGWCRSVAGGWPPEFGNR